MSKQFVCDFCKKPYNKNSGLKTHLRRLHNTNSNPSAVSNAKANFSRRCYEEDCDFSCLSTSELVEHLNKIHNLSEFKVNQKEFDSVDAFQRWKLQLEKDTMCYFVASRKKTSPDGLTKNHYYQCSRTGHYTHKPNRKRRIKSQGSKKINAICTAFIVFKENQFSSDDVPTLTANYCEIHYGHGIDLKHLSLTLPDRLTIATHISRGVPDDEIIKHFTDGGVETTERMKFLTHKDLSNIKREFNLMEVDEESNCSSRPTYKDIDVANTDAAIADVDKYTRPDTSIANKSMKTRVSDVSDESDSTEDKYVYIEVPPNKIVFVPADLKPNKIVFVPVDLKPENVNLKPIKFEMPSSSSSDSEVIGEIVINK